MDKEQIRKLIKEVYEKVFDEPGLEVTDALNATMVEKWDSLTHLTMISEIEEKFAVKFKLKELVALKNTGDLIALIQTKLGT